MLEIRNLCKQYEISSPLKDINVTINDGDVVSIIGPSGTGKSTLLRMINLLEKPTSGQILLNGEDITDPKYKPENARRQMTMVFQNFNLFNHLSVIENLVEPQIDILNKTKDEAYESAMEALKKVGLQKQYLNYPSSLSGGQKQRVAIARALVMKPEIILFDEPTSALDPIMVEEIATIMKDLASEGKTMIIVTHDMKLAESVSTRIIYLDQGIVYEDDTPEVIFHNPTRSRTKAFIESLTVFKCSIHNDYNYAEISNKLEEYITSLSIRNKLANQLRSVLDELINQILITEYNCKHILVLASFDKKNSLFYITIKYDGQLSNALFGYDEPRIILNSFASEVAHSPITEENYTNCLKFVIK